MAEGDRRTDVARDTTSWLKWRVSDATSIFSGHVDLLAAGGSRDRIQWKGKFSLFG
jgi:hypothetical protein